MNTRTNDRTNDPTNDPANDDARGRRAGAPLTSVTAADGTRLHVKDWGAGRPVILMHGWPLSADSWDDVAMALADAGLRAIAYDRRGFGRSDQPWSGYDYDTLADDLAAVIDAAGVGRGEATIVGFSMGGGEVARYLSRHGAAKVRQAVLIGSIVPFVLKTADNPGGVPEAQVEAMKKGIREDRAKFFGSFFDDFYSTGLLTAGAGAEVKEWSRQVAMQAGLKPTIACVDAFARTDLRPDLKSFTVPTLIMHGDVDKNVPIQPTSRTAAKAIAGAKYVEIGGAGHGLLVTHRQKVIDELLAFVRG